MSKKISVGIDVGTYQVKVVITELTIVNGVRTPRIIGKGLFKSKGLRHGYIINKNEVTHSIIQAVSQAEDEAKIKVKKALAMAINKNEIVSLIFDGEARTIDGPILPTSFAYNSDLEKIKFNLENAKKSLDETDWKEIEISEEDMIKATAEEESADEKIKASALLTLEQGPGKWRVKNDNFLKIYLSTVETEDNIEVIKGKVEKKYIHYFK